MLQQQTSPKSQLPRPQRFASHLHYMFSVDRQGDCDHSLRAPGCLSSYHPESQTSVAEGRENLSLVPTSQCSVPKAAHVISALYSLTKTTRPHPMTWEPESTILP